MTLEAPSLTVAWDPNREESLSPFIQEDGTPLIRTGSVKRQKQEIELKYGANEPKKIIGVEDAAKADLSETQDLEVPMVVEISSADVKCGKKVETSVETQAPASQVAVKITAETPECEVTPEGQDQTKSRSSSVGTPAYPDEDIEWSVGTVKQHKAAIESKAKEIESECQAGKKSPDGASALQTKRMSGETLSLIRAVGSEWLASPVKSKRQSAATPKGRGLVRKLSTDIENRAVKSFSPLIETDDVFHDGDLEVDLVKTRSGHTKGGQTEKVSLEAIVVPTKKAVETTTTEVQVKKAQCDSATKTVHSSPGSSDLEGSSGKCEGQSPTEEVKVKSLLEMFELRDSSAKKSQDKLSTSPVKTEGHSKVTSASTSPESRKHDKDADRHGDSPVKKYAKRSTAAARPKSFSGQTASGRQRSDFAKGQPSSSGSASGETSQPPLEPARPRTRSYASIELKDKGKTGEAAAAATISGSRSPVATGPTVSGFSSPPRASQDPSLSPRKARKLQGKSHPLSKLTGEPQSPGRTPNPLYNTM